MEVVHYKEHAGFTLFLDKLFQNGYELIVVGFVQFTFGVDFYGATFAEIFDCYWHGFF